ncbi:MAG: PG1 protein [Desulfonauticus sp. 38_4375]|nr:MAG: PG1 protein [Desulfonauticus sp. 38_4375]
MPPTRALRPVIPNNARTLRITAAAGTELAGASSGGTVSLAACSTTKSSSLLTKVYDPKAFFPHAALLGQGFPHCPIFPTAASRRSLGRVPVPVWPVTLSGRLPIVALVGHYPTN